MTAAKILRLIALLLVLPPLFAQAAERYAFPKADLARMIDLFARDVANPRYYALDGSLDSPQALTTDAGETAEYVAFNLIPSVKGAQGFGPTYFMNIVSGQVFRLDIGCTEQTSPRLTAYLNRYRTRHPIPAETLAKHQAHFQKLLAGADICSK